MRVSRDTFERAVVARRAPRARLREEAPMMTRSIALLALVSGCTVQTGGTDAGDLDGSSLIPLDSGPSLFDAGSDAGPCEPGMIACDGTCTRVAWDSLNCGSCGNACPPMLTCANGLCDCMAPMTSCDGVCTDTMTDQANCGACGNACAATDMCLEGECTVMCSSPEVLCRELFTMNPVCADLATDELNCGSCNGQCINGAACVAGRCGCPSGQINCSGRCVDTASDAANCGSCGVSCGAGGTCTDRRCSCGSDRTDCSGLCVDLDTDRFNCGMCGRTCALGQSCVDGTCGCPAPRETCGSACVDVANDPSNCGMCGRSCGANGVCRDGACACVAGYELCGTTCRDTASDLSNCGECGNVCPPLAGGMCRGGACGCAPGLSVCGGACSDTTIDRNNCGSCGNVCAAGQTCYSRACTSTPPTRYTQVAPALTSVPFIDACAAPGHTEHLASMDEGSVRVPLPFGFRFWATDLPAGSMINVTTNGWIGMDGATSMSSSGTIPSTSAPNAVIAAHWGNNHTRGPICVATVGTAPSRQFVVQWNDTHYSGSTTAHLTYEIILSEATQFIDIAYGPMMGTQARVMGIENQAGSSGINACRGGASTCSPTEGQRVRFLPAP
jgi:hypothetical protein